MGTNWTREREPKTAVAVSGVKLINRTLWLIERLDPHYFIIENPMSILRKLDLLRHVERRYVTYCPYGEERMKPTDLWGWFPEPLELRTPCKIRDRCHVSSPRGSRTAGSTQGHINDHAAKARIPGALALDICIATEVALETRAPLSSRRD